MDTELMEITLNYEGEDYNAVCDIQTANILVNGKVINVIIFKNFVIVILFIFKSR